MDKLDEYIEFYKNIDLDQINPTLNKMVWTKAQIESELETSMNIFKEEKNEFNFSNNIQRPKNLNNINNDETIKIEAELLFNMLFKTTQTTSKTENKQLLDNQQPCSSKQLKSNGSVETLSDLSSSDLSSTPEIKDFTLPICFADDSAIRLEKVENPPIVNKRKRRRDNDDETRQCLNIKCRTTETTQWRKSMFFDGYVCK